MLKIDISRDDFCPKALTVCQRAAAEGKYASALAGYIRWLAPQYEQIRRRLRAEHAELRTRVAACGQHARTPGIVANLALGLRYLLTFAETVGAVTPERKRELWTRGFTALMKAGEDQAAQIQATEPASQFLRFLSASLMSGRSHMANPNGGKPEHPEHWGWQEIGLQEWRAQGHRVGWVDGDSVFLKPEAACAAVQELARDQGESFPITELTLRRRLKEQGFLRTIDEPRKKLTIRKTLQGIRQNVLHLGVSAFSIPDTDVQNHSETQQRAENGPVSWAGNRTENQPPDHPLVNENAEESGKNGELGRLGRSRLGEREPGDESLALPQEWDEA
jgi:hypothetical protein